MIHAHFTLSELERLNPRLSAGEILMLLTLPAPSRMTH